VEINLLQSQNVEIGATGAAEIYQNVRTILLTRKGTVPLDRQFGLDVDLLDTATPRTRALLSAAVPAAVATYEPRARVESVEFAARGTGDVLQPTVRISIIGES
jgi:hypothetical protein